MPAFLQDPAHHAELRAEAARLLGFIRGAVHPDGGFGWLDDDGRLEADIPVELWVTCRMTHVAALGLMSGAAWCAGLVDAGLAALTGRLHDDEHGGWYASVSSVTPGGASVAEKTDKEAYGHAFVILAASAALAARRPGAQELLDDALAVHQEHFWDEEQGLIVDVWNRDWSELEPYRGVNAAMHTVEAFLAVADVTGSELHRSRARRIVERVLGWAEDNHWRIPEHFDPEWHPDADYNRATPSHPFRPYGATVGHALEWSRLVLLLDPSLAASAAALFDRAVVDGWAADGADGFVYTTDWAGVPVVRQRLHWVVAEGLAAASVLHAVTGETAYDEHYARWWAYARDHLIDLERGSWHHELDEHNAVAATVWAGKPDVYHAYQAVLVPRLPVQPSFAAALRAGLLAP